MIYYSRQVFYAADIDTGVKGMKEYREAIEEWLDAGEQTISGRTGRPAWATIENMEMRPDEIGKAAPGVVRRGVTL
jgi:hypothetical protein